MAVITLSEPQRAIAERTDPGAVFLEGTSGAGKTTAGVARTRHLLTSGVRADSIAILLPQRTLAGPYHEALRDPELSAGGQVMVVTLSGLARRMLDLFWPLVAEQAGFGNPAEQPTFLTLETAQYYMAQLVQPLLDGGFFSSVTIPRNRLYSQILDNLNKSAVVGFPYTEIGERLMSAWVGEESQKRIFEEAQICATTFREACLRRNLLDFSLQIEVFVNQLWPQPFFQEYLMDRHRHLIVDNVEEDTAVAHDLLAKWLEEAETALVIYDHDGGYRRFLGADPQNAQSLKRLCQEHVTFNESFVTSRDIRAFAAHLARSMKQPVEQAEGDIRSVLRFEYHRYHPQMLDWVAEEIATLVHEQSVPPGEIVVLAPFMSDGLRFSLMNLLGRKDVPVRSHRPSRPLREEPATRCLLTLASIAHPQWGVKPTVFDVAYALMMAVEGLDLVRAHLLSKILYRIRDGVPTLEAFEGINPEMQNRVTYKLGERYQGLREWIEAYLQGPEVELDHFLSRLFGEVLSQQGYGFHKDYDAGSVTANLIESIQKFRWVLGEELSANRVSIGAEYVRMVREGLVAAQYVRSWELEPDDAVLLTPAYTFLMANRPLDYQFWLNIGGRGWWERLYQPLTHPYVLSRHWSKGAPWTDADEVRTRSQALFTLTQGLIRRCRKGIYLGLSELGEGGYEQRGPLLAAVQRTLLAVGMGEAGDV